MGAYTYLDTRLMIWWRSGYRSGIRLSDSWWGGKWVRNVVLLTWINARLRTSRLSLEDPISANINVVIDVESSPFQVQHCIILFWFTIILSPYVVSMVSPSQYRHLFIPLLPCWIGNSMIGSSLMTLKQHLLPQNRAQMSRKCRLLRRLMNID